MPRRTCNFSSPKPFVLGAVLPLVGLAACAAPYERPSAEFAPSYAPPVTQPAQPTGAIYQPGRFASLVEDNRARRVGDVRSEGHTSELQSLMRISYAVFC